MSQPPAREKDRQPANSAKAQIIGPDQHPIKLEMIDRDALFILRKLNKAGYAGYLVGGGVRDLFLGKKPKDFDISTDARPGQLRKLFPKSRTIGRRFRLVQIFFTNGKTIEVSTLRSLSEHDLDGPEEVLAPNNTFGTLSEDARRRDLTINSLFYEIENNTIIDYVNGIQDLQHGVIQIVGDPDKRIRRDPVRMLRAIRHSARNNFTIEKKSWQAVCANSAIISLCPSSRIRDEFFKDLYSGSSAPWFSLAADSLLFPHLFPIYAPLFSQHGENKATVISNLYNIFQTIDRINTLCVSQNIHRQVDHFLLALVLIPWLEYEFQLFTQKRKGATLFQLAKQIRSHIDHTIGKDLNLKRHSRQEIVSLTVNLAQLLHRKENGDWPKWLKKKSYFPKCLLFYSCYQEATHNIPVELQLLTTTSAKKSTPPGKTAKPENSQKSRPAFSPQRKGGIFGLKKY